MKKFCYNYIDKYYLFEHLIYPDKLLPYMPEDTVPKCIVFLGRYRLLQDRFDDFSKLNEDYYRARCDRSGIWKIRRMYYTDIMESYEKMYLTMKAL